jgi:hypothetical protein
MARHDSYPIAFPILDDAQITALGQFATFESVPRGAGQSWPRRERSWKSE